MGFASGIDERVICFSAFFVLNCFVDSIRHTIPVAFRRRAPGNSRTGTANRRSHHLAHRTLQACVGPAAGIELADLWESRQTA